MAEDKKKTIESSAPTSYVIPKLARGDDGQIYTVYVDAFTGQIVTDLTGKKILSGQDSVANVPLGGTSSSTDENGDKPTSVSQNPLFETQKGDGFDLQSDVTRNVTHSTDPMNNYGYVRTPALVSLASKLPGPLGMAAKGINAMYNLNAAQAANTGRTMLGLDPLSPTNVVRQTLKNNKGQLTDTAKINGKNYAVGFEALSPTGKTNLTPMEAYTRAAMTGTPITEDTQKIKNPSTFTKAMDKVLGTDEGTKKSKIEQVTGLEKGWLGKTLGLDKVKDKLNDIGLSKGWATRGLDSLFGVDKVDLPDTAPTPTIRPSNVDYSQAGPLSDTSQTQRGLVDTFGDLTKPSITKQSNDSLGRVPIGQVDFDNIGLNKDFAARVKDFAQAAQDMGLDLSVDVNNTRRTPEEQQAIMDAGYSKTPVSYHNTGFAVDISPTAIDVNGQIADQKTLSAMRDLAKAYGFGTLNPSWDPAHIQASIPGLTARQLANMPQDAFGNVQLSPEQTLNLRQGSVPTPTTKPENVKDKIDPVGDSLNPVATTSLFNPQAQPQNYSQSLISDRVNTDLPSQMAPNFAISNATPAKMASLGLTKRSPDQIDAISRTIAGELSQKSLQGLQAGDVNAMTEVANMITSIENRAASTMYGTLENALNPTQYNSLMDTKALTTNQNYNNYKTVLDEALGSFYNGSLTPSNYGITSYYNPNKANPDWGGLMTDSVTAGQHLFGTLPEYGASKSFKENRSFYEPQANYAGGGFSTGYSALDTPSERNASMRLDSSRSATGGYNIGGGGGSGLNSAGNRATGAGPMSSRNTATSGNGGNGGGGIGSSLGGGLNSAGNRTSGAGPGASGNTKTTGSGFGSTSASREASNSRSKTSAGAGKSAGTAGGHNAD